MFRATLKSLLSRKIRLTLSAMAVVLGVMFVSGAFVLTDTIGRSFDALFETAYSTVDVQVTRPPRSGNAADSTLVAEPIPANLVDEIRAIPGVAKVTGTVMMEGARVLSPKTGKVLSGGMGVPNYGGNWTGEDELIQLRSGRGPNTETEVAINAGLAKAGGFTVGSRLDALLPAQASDDPTAESQRPRRRTFTVVGIFGFSGGRDSLSGETMIAFTTPVAQDLMLGVPNVFSEIDVRVGKGHSDRAVRDAIQRRIGTTWQVKTGEQAAKAASDLMREQLKFFNYILLGFAGIALFVGVFIILNTFSIIVAQRIRELALMRALGAGRGQVLMAVLAEALVIGLIASVLGLLAGIGIGAGLALLATKLIENMRLASIGIPLTAVIASFAVGILITLIAALVPAVRAAKIPPMAALQEAATPDRPLTRITAGGAVVTTVGVIALTLGLTDHAAGHPLLAAFGGILATFVGIALLTPLLARPAVNALGKIFARSVPGDLGRRNTARNPRRTAITAAALMVGVALVTAISTLFTSATKSTDRLMDQSLHANLLIYGLQTGQLPPTFDPAVLVNARRQSEVAKAAGYWYDTARSADGTTLVSASDDLPALISICGTRLVRGQMAPLRAGQIVIDDRMARDRKLTLGSTIQLGLARTDDRAYTVVGIFHRNELLAGTFLSPEDIRNMRSREPQTAFIQLRPGANVGAVKDRIEQMLTDSPDISVVDRSDYLKQQTRMLNVLLGFIQILLALAMLIAVLGVINTLALSIIERTRELGLLRAVGLSRAQTARMITVESVVISLFGAVLGIVVGAGLGAAVVAALRDQGYRSLAFPYPLMVAYLVAAGIVGVIAAIIPAFRAARLNVLGAIAHE